MGLSNYDGATLIKAEKILRDLHCPFIINQNKYSILDRTVEKNGLLTTSYELGKGVICFSPLAQGMLTDKYLKDIPADSRVVRDGRFLKVDNILNNREHLLQLNAIATEAGLKLSEMAICWLLNKPEVTTVLIGASRPEQLLEDLGAIGSMPLNFKDLALIDQIALS